MSDLLNDQTEYRIEYQIQRRLADEDDFTEIGFGSSGGWSSVEQAAYILSSEVQHKHWTPTLAEDQS